VARKNSTLALPIGFSRAFLERELELEGFSLHPAPLRRIRWRVAKTRGPLRAVFRRAGEFFLDALWREREENTSQFCLD